MLSRFPEELSVRAQSASRRSVARPDRPAGRTGAAACSPRAMAASLIGVCAEAQEPSFYGLEADWGPIAVIRRSCHRGTLYAWQCRLLEQEYGVNATVRQRRQDQVRELTVRGRAGALVRPGRVLVRSPAILSHVVFWSCPVSAQGVSWSPQVVAWLRPRSILGFSPGRSFCRRGGSVQPRWASCWRDGAASRSSSRRTASAARVFAREPNRSPFQRKRRLSGFGFLVWDFRMAEFRLSDFQISDFRCRVSHFPFELETSTSTLPHSDTPVSNFEFQNSLGFALSSSRLHVSCREAHWNLLRIVLAQTRCRDELSEGRNGRPRDAPPGQRASDARLRSKFQHVIPSTGFEPLFPAR